MKKSDIIFTILIVAFIMYLIIRGIGWQINVSKLNKSGVFLTAEIVEIKSGRGSTVVEYKFEYDDNEYFGQKLCNLSSINKMKIGDLYLIKYNQSNNFSVLDCDCKINKENLGNIWNRKPIELCK